MLITTLQLRCGVTMGSLVSFLENDLTATTGMTADKQQPVTSVGVIAGGFKPFHQGHWMLVQKALSENAGGVFLFVSTDSRSRPGEFEITGPRMTSVWDTILIPALASYNIKVELTKTPVLSVYELLRTKTVGEGVTYNIYADKNDAVKNYPGNRMAKNNPELFAAGMIKVVGVGRFAEGISGTKMRLALQLGLKEDFIEGLPDIVRSQGDRIWQLLGGDTV